MFTIRKAAALAMLGISAVPGHAGQNAPKPIHMHYVKATRYWTLEDIVTAPQVPDLLLTRDRKSALYIDRRANLSSNSVVSTLHLVDLASKTDRILLTAPWIDRLRTIPDSDDWSVLTDIGHGVQLYRIDRNGLIAPVVINNDIILVGNADGMVADLRGSPPLQIGILSYDWSPDGKMLWYSVLTTESLQQRIVRDEEVSRATARPRGLASAHVDFHMRTKDGRDVKALARPTSDRIARYLNGNPRWTGSALTFFAEDSAPSGASQFIAFRWDTDRQKPVRIEGVPQDPHGTPSTGLHGGRLDTVGYGDDRTLVETMPDGRHYDYGKADFLVGDPRSAGSWRATDGASALIGTRRITHPGYGLTLVDRRGVHILPIPGSVTKCDFSADLEFGVCIRETLTTPPELVIIKPRQHSVRRIASLSPAHDGIMPLRAEAQRWTNRLGYISTGFVIYPRHYVKGERYPAIVVTHGSDADDRFANEDLQWNYPIQFFAERGYVVILMNDPSPGQDAKLMAAYDAWGSADGRVKPDDVERLIWLNGVYSYEDAMADMIHHGLVDPERIGIAGYSRGSQMVNVTMTQSHVFRAASSGDGGFLEPGAYPDSVQSYTAIFGGTPYDRDNLERYRRLSPSLRATSANGPILQQMAAPMSGALELFEALRKAHIPTQITLYPGETPAAYETHIFHIPSNRLAAMRENMAWFDFWLRGTQTPDPSLADQPDLADQYVRWRRMADSAPHELLTYNY